MTRLMLLSLLCAACSALPVVQTALEPYSVEISATVTDAQGHQVVKGVWANSRFIAVDLSQIEGNVVFRGPAVYGGPIVELKRLSANTGDANPRRVWQIVLPKADGEHTQLVESTWAAARASIPAMPE